MHVCRLNRLHLKEFRFVLITDFLSTVCSITYIFPGWIILFILKRRFIKVKMMGQNLYELEAKDNGAFDPEPCCSAMRTGYDLPLWCKSLNHDLLAQRALSSEPWQQGNFLPVWKSHIKKFWAFSVQLCYSNFKLLQQMENIKKHK